jgi:putative MATE family efflux protein
MPISFWYMIMYSIQASGDAMTPMRVEIFIRLLHVALCPFLVFGWWVFPRMGVIGVATSHVTVECLGLSLGLWILFSGRTRLRLTLRGFRLDLNILWRIVRIGLPACVMGMQRSFGNLILAWFMVPFGTLAVAAHSLGQRVDMILLLPSFGLSIASGVLVGQNLGAGQPERAERSGWLAVGVVEGFMLICAAAVLLWAENIVGIFSTEPGLVDVASAFLRIAAAGYLVVGFIAVLQQSISGAGETLPAMLVSVATVWMVQLPLAFLLPRVTGLGVYGIRWAIVAGMVVGAVTYATYFRLGRWKHKSI